ncbi:FkbM family methyltransferase [Brachyspira murdochii]|uniref:FkbM family methyltransferase n=1 Tax=Brachyspira murdochii TaxID=84378 RepID=UPI00300786BA
MSDSKKQIFLDLGAYVGDTVEKFIEHSEGIFDKIYAFEPGDKQFSAMNIRVSRLIREWAIDSNSIILEKLGISDTNKEVFFDESCDILSSNITNNETGIKIKVVSVDEYLNGRPITFLKSDIEGEELNMLKGASETIKKYKPKMAISIYHRPDDFFTIPEFIKSLVPEYKFYLRHHSITFAETVLYCCI